MFVKKTPGRNLASERLRNIRFDRELQTTMEELGLPDFETRLDCDGRQSEMIRRLAKFHPATSLEQLAQCSVHECSAEPCLEVCHYATLHRRANLMKSGLPIMSDHSGPKKAVCIVHPAWEAKVGELSEINMKGAAQWNYRRLAALKIPGLVAMGIFEASINRELNGTLHWAGEIQQIVAGASESQLERAFEIERRYRTRRPGQKMVDVRKFDSLPRKFAYAQKRLVQERTAYAHDNGRQHRSKNPPRPEHWAEWDAWLAQLPIGARTILFGCSRRGLKIFPR